jgi:acyl dehydratase
MRLKVNIKGGECFIAHSDPGSLGNYTITAGSGVTIIYAGALTSTIAANAVAVIYAIDATRYIRIV